MNTQDINLTAKDISLIGMMVAVIEVCKIALSGIPNVELITFWIIIFSIYLGKRIFYVIPIFIILEGSMYGFGLWWIMYLYTWPSLALISTLLRKMNSALMWSILAGLYGLLYGLFCSIPYIFIGTIDANLATGLRTAFTWWIAGIPWDIVHGISNFVIMLVLYHPITSVMNKTKYLYMNN